MTGKRVEQQDVELLATQTTVTLEELCLACRVDEDWVGQLVEEGAIEPEGLAQAEWRFTSSSIVRVAKAKRLHRDLSINAAGLALVLDLLDQIDDLRAQLLPTHSATRDPDEAR